MTVDSATCEGSPKLARYDPLVLALPLMSGVAALMLLLTPCLDDLSARRPDVGTLLVRDPIATFTRRG